MSDGTVWVCGQHRGHTEDGSPAWDLQGIFSTEELAKGECKNPFHFIGPVQIDVGLPIDAQDWPGCYYPISVLTPKTDQILR